MLQPKIDYTPEIITPKTVDEFLDQVNYKELNSGSYIPSAFALKFMNFIKLVNGGEGESSLTPVVHLKMLDKIASKHDRVANLCARGMAKTTLMFEYFALYIGVFGELDGFGKLDGIIYVSDTMENGVKSARKNIEHRYENSEFLQSWMPRDKVKFTDAYIEFGNRDGGKVGIRMFGAKALSLDSKLYRADGGTITIGEVRVGDRIMGADGKPTTITRKSEVFNKPMYELVLDDGRKLKVSEDHLNQVHVKKFQSKKTFSKFSLEEKTLTTLELLQEPLFAIDPNGSKRPLLWVKNAKPMEWPENQDLLLDPYTAGVLIGDGSMNRKASGASSPVVLTGHENDWPTLEREIPYQFGKVWRDNRHPETISRTVLGISQFVAMHGLDCHGDVKRIPKEFLYGSVAQRLALLQGLMDTDGTCTKDGKSSFCSASKGLVEDVMWLVRSLGGTARWVGKRNTRAYQCAVRVNMPIFRLQRKLHRQRPLANDKMAIVEINRIADEPSQCIAVDNEERQFIAEDFFRTHNTGIRGTKIFGKRPQIAVLDDLVSDEDAKSKTSMDAIKDTVYKGVFYALDPKKKKIIFNGTPFNKSDILYEAVESGQWDVNVWPVCEKFPCTKEEFNGAWEDRFTFEYVLDAYKLALGSGELASFNQELMLRISSEEERLVPDSIIDSMWYSRKKLMDNIGAFNIYITTDFATTEKQNSDYSVISVWAYSSNKDWYWIDGIVKKQDMGKNLDDLFKLVGKYRPQQVGIEVSGQQGGFIPWIREKMMDRNIWFNLATNKGINSAGINPTVNKLGRFNEILPQIISNKVFIPLELKTDPRLVELVNELKFATVNGLKAKYDDVIDTISMLAYLAPWQPTDSSVLSLNPDTQEDEPTGSSNLYNMKFPGDLEETSPLSSYI